MIYTMLVYDISETVVLPPVSHWLCPKFASEGDRIFSTLVGKKGNFNDPKDWKKDFPEYVYQYPGLQKIKNELNAVKQKINPIYDDPQLSIKYEKITDIVRLHEDLRTQNGRLVKEFGAEIATNAWMKMYELCTLLDTIFKKFNNPKNPKKLNTFHIAEAPGTFMLAINHYLNNHYPTIDWHWVANSYRDLYSSTSGANTNTHYLKDQYGLISKFKNNWIFGADGDGDITSPANLQSFQVELEKKLGPVQIITSDVKYVPININFDEEERYNIPVHMGHLLASLICLEKGGIMILKEFTFLEAESISLLYIICSEFKKVLIVKPETSRPANSEVYIVAYDYKKKLSPLQLSLLLKIMGYIQFLNTDMGSPSIFLKEDIPKSFVKSIEKVMQDVSRRQKIQIERNLSLFEKYKDKSFADIRADMAKIRKKTSDSWIKKVKILPLEQSKRIGNIKE